MLFVLFKQSQQYSDVMKKGWTLNAQLEFVEILIKEDGFRLLSFGLSLLKDCTAALFVRLKWFKRYSAFVALTFTAALIALNIGLVTAAPPAPGTPITNVSNSVYDVGVAVNATTTSNTVTATVGAPPSAPNLTKTFGAASIISGGVTALTFTITNPSAVLVTAATFTDTLPTSLRLIAGASALVGGSVGCNATVNLTPTSIAVTNLTVPSSGTCTITVNSVTNQPLVTNLSCMANPAAFTNSLTNISAVVGLNNQVLPQCLVVTPAPGVATLTKAFSPTTIAENAVAGLKFSISNSVGNPAQTGIAFTDTLPSGLKLTPMATGTVTGAGCVATVTLSSTNTIAVTALSMTVGTALCEININGVTNQAGQTNSSCAMPLAPFTNGATNISGVVNVSNSVTNQCLTVTPTGPPPPPVLDPATFPTLIKAFDSPVIVAGEWTALTFTLIPSATPVNYGGYGFDDILPPGLAFRDTPNATMEGGGCTGEITFASYAPPQQNIVRVRNISIVDVTKTCTIRIEGVTNKIGQFNPSNCGQTNAPDFTNTPNRITDIEKINNGVTPQCLRVLPPLPSLTKSFGDDRIYDGDTTSLTLTLRNTVGRPQVSGISFTDTLPAGLRLLPTATFNISGVGCTGVVNLTANQVSVRNFNIAAGTLTCNIVVSNVTNTVGQLNPSCSGGPGAFTNSTTSISGIANAHNFVENSCLIVEPANPALDMTVAKTISANQGYSPSGPYTVTLTVSNPATTPNARKRNITIADSLPSGMTYVPGSLNVSVGGGSLVASMANGSGAIGSRAVTYSTSTSQIQVGFDVIEPGDTVRITFAVTIDPSLARETILTNTGTLSFTNSADRRLNRTSNPATFRVLGALAVTVTGQTIATANPGDTLLFRNTITNRGNIADTYDITLSGSNFPPGTVITLLNSAGTGPLTDTSGNGVPDTGVVAAGAAAIVVVRVVLPNSVLPGGPYRVTKTARSVLSGNIVDSDDDVLTAIGRSCQVRLVPDNTGRVRPGASITYGHTLTNTGNCVETITGGVTGTAGGWTGIGYLDPASVQGGTIAGLGSSANPPAATSVTLQPGQSANYLVVVTSPTTARNGDVATHIISVTSTSNAVPNFPSQTRVLSNRDVTTVDANATNLPDDIIRGFIDGIRTRPTFFAFIGTDLFIRANAASCNAEPDVIERRLIIITGPNGEREEIIGIETGPNTGIFDASIPVRLPPVIAGDGVIEGNPFDTFEIEIVGCGRRIATSVTLIDPNGVVFDSRTNVPVAGATVRIVTAINGVCTNTLAAVQALQGATLGRATNPVVTGTNGRFDFPLVSPGDYCVQVQPPNGYTWTSIVPAGQLAQFGRNLITTGPTTGGSYGGAFRVGPDTGPVILDIPVDPGLINGLFIRKEVLRPIVELGEFADYTVTINNQTGYALIGTDVIAVDDLPAGFTYVRGSARVEGKPIADPLGGGGPRLTFNVGKIDLGKQIKLTYRVRVGPSALQGDGVNRVIANYRVPNANLFSVSNIATARVTVSAGVFTDRAYIVGKVFTDCNNDQLQTGATDKQRAEVGIPGVRLFLEDGTSAITDAEGKYSFYGISPRTHVLKMDRTTLPESINADELTTFSNRNLGKGDSRFLDLKNGEMHKANFAINCCSPSAIKEIDERRTASARLSAEIDGRLQQRLNADPLVRTQSDVKALPASGTVGQNLVPSNANTTSANVTPTLPASAVSTLISVTTQTTAVVGATSTTQAGAAGSFAPLANPVSQPIPDPARALRELNAAPKVAVAALEEILPLENNSLGFIGLKNGDIVPFAQTAIRVKGVAGATFTLSVNGKLVNDSRIGKRAVLDDKQLQAWEYIGVDLVAGENELLVKQTDSFGNSRGEMKIIIRAPGELAEIKVDFGERVRVNGGAIADGKTPVKVTVRLLDKAGTPVTSRTAITLSANLGRWDVQDLNPVEPGVQVFVQDGVGEFTILPPTEPGQALIGIESGRVKVNVALDFLPELRQLLASGLIEGIINLRKFDSRALVPTRQQDGFESEITHISRNWNDGKYQAGARAAMFIKGKVKGDYLLTLAYDSDKETRERLFRDIQPDEFYPVYGDSSVRGFDAQSTGRFYLRVDNKKSYLLYGDYNTSVGFENRQLSNYNRSLTGIKQHYETAKVQANIFASRDSTKQVIDEFSANGTSGPFVLTNVRGLINSEKIEVLTRDRNQSSIILRSVPLSRFVDYELEPLTGRILLKAPVASLDENLNPISLRISYEVEQGGPEFWVTGADAQVKLTDGIEVGAAIVDDRNPIDKFRMMSINSVARIADKTFIIAEIARTSREKFIAGQSLSEVDGFAKRIELRRKDGNFDGNIFVAKSDAGFDNPNASISKGRTEAGGKMSYRLDEKTSIRGELLSTQENLTGAKRDGILLSAERTLATGIRGEVGLRHARDTQAPVLPGNTGTAGQSIKNEVTTLRGRLTGDVPGVKDAIAYGEAEVDVQDSQKKILALGGEYKLPGNGRLYARHEFISSISGPYGLNTQQRQNSTIVGVNTDYMKDGNLFSEYRVRDAISGGDAEAALGLRNMWTLTDGVKLQTGFERVHALAGSGNAESTALTLGLEYTANPLWKASSRLELRDGKTQDSILSTVALASKLNSNWTFLGRNTFSLLKNKGAATGENQQDRMQLGLAYRDTDTDVWNALGRIEYRSENDTTQPDVVLKRTVEIASLHANWQPLRPFTFSGRYAAKRVNENSNGIASRNTTQLLAGRAIWEIAPRWDASLNASTLLGRGTAAKQYGLGLELGFMVMENLWLSAGYNWFGYRDEDLAFGEYTNKGAFIRLRYKFDEDLFGKTKKASDANNAPKVCAPGEEKIVPPAATAPAPDPIPVSVPAPVVIAPTPIAAVSAPIIVDTIAALLPARVAPCVSALADR
jgi:large repetitive protein